MADNKVTVKLAFEAETAKAKQQIQELQRTLSNITLNTKTVDANGVFSKEINNAIIEAGKLKGIIDACVNTKTGSLDLSKMYKEFNNAGLSIDDVRKKLVAVGPDGQKAFNQLSDSILMAKKPTTELTALVDKLWTGLKKTAAWQFESSAIHAMTRALNDSVQYAEKLNKNLTDIRIVTGYSADKMASFATQANKAAKALSTTTNEYVKGSLIFYQQGLSDEAVLERTNTTIKLANTSGETAEAISSYMTAIWNNFDNGAKSVEYYADVISYLGAVSAASNADIAEGMQAFAATANTVGLSYEYAAGALTTLVDKTQQSASVIGNSLKTILARLDSVKLGDTLEDDVNLTKYTKALSDIGVNVLDATGEIKKMDTILDEMADKWVTLSNSQKSAVAQTIGGVRQYNNLISLMDNYDSFKEYVSGAESSDGYLQGQADIYAESWEAAQKRVQTAFESIYQQLLDDKVFIKITNAIAKIVEGISSIIDKIGGLKTVLPVIIGLFAKFAGSDIFAELSEQVEKSALTLKRRLAEDEAIRKSIAKQTTDETYRSTEGVRLEHKRVKVLDLILDRQDKLSTAERGYIDLLRERMKIETKAANKAVDNSTYLEQQSQARIEMLFGKSGDSEWLTKYAKASNKYAKALNIGDLVASDIWDSDKTTKQYLAALKNQKKMGNLQDAYGNKVADIIAEGAKDKNVSGADIRAKLLQQQVAYLKSYEKTFTKLAEEDLQTLNKKAEELSKSISKNEKALEKIQKQKAKKAATGKVSDEEKNALDIQEQQIREKLEQDKADAKVVNDARNAIDQTSKELGKSIDTTTQQLEDSMSKQIDWGKNLSALTTGISMAHAAFSSFANVIDIWNDETLSPWEKITSLVTAFASGISTAAIAIKAFKEAEIVETATATLNAGAKSLQAFAQSKLNKEKAKGVEITKESAKEETKEAAATTANNVAKGVKKGAGKTAEAGGTAAATGGFAGLKTAISGFGTALKATLAVIWPYLAVLAGLTIVIGGVVWAYTKEARAAKKAREESESAAKAAAEAETKYKELANAFKEYDEGQKALSQLTTGTQEFADALDDANNKVMDLLKTYPELAQYVSAGEYGQLVISQEGIDTVTNKYKDIATTARNASYAAQIKTNEAEYVANRTDVRRKMTQTTSTPGTYGEAETTETTYASNTDVETALRMWNTQPEAFANLETFTEAFKKEVPNATDELCKAVYNGKDALVDFATTTKEANAANQIYAYQIGNSLYGEEVQKQTFSEDSAIDVQTKTAITTVLGNTVAQATQDLYDSTYKDGMGMTDAEVQDWYAEQLGAESVTNKFGNKGVYTFADGSTRTIKDSDARWAYAQAMAQEQNPIDVNQKIAEIEQAVAGFGDAQQLSLLNLAAGNTSAFNSMDVNEMKEFLEIFNDPAKKEELLSNWEVLGYDSVEAYEEALTAGVEKYNYNALANRDIIAWDDDDYISQMSSELEVSNELLDTYSELLQENRKELGLDEKAAQKMALANIQMNKGLEELSKSWEDNFEALQRGFDGDSSYEYAEALTSVKQALSDVFGVEVDNNFVEDNLEKIKALAEGDMTALDELSAVAGRAFIESLDDIGPIIDEETNKIINGVENAKQKFLEMFDALANQDPNINIDNYIATLNEMLAAGQITAEQVNSALGTIGYSPKMGTEKKEQQTVHTYTHQVDNGETWTETVTDKYDVEVPTIDGLNYTGKKSAGVSISNSTGGSNTAGSSSSSKSTKKKSDEIERYHVIKEELEDINNELDRIAAAKDRAFGQSKIDLLNQEVATYDQLISKQKEYLQQIEGNYNSDASAILGYGANIKNGVITNYDSLVGRYVDAYNAGAISDEQYDAFKQALSNFEDSSDLYAEQLQELTKLQNERIDKLLEIVDEKVNLTLELNNDEIAYFDFLLETVHDDALDAADAIALLSQETENWLDSADAYTQGIKNVLGVYGVSADEAQALLNGTASIDELVDKYGIDAQGVEKLKAYRDELMNISNTLIELRDKIYNKFIEVAEEFSEKIDEQSEKVTRASNVLSHYKNIIDIVGKDALGISDELVQGLSDAMVNMSVSQVQISKTYLEGQKEQLAEAQKVYEAALASGSEEDIKLAKEKVDELQAMVDETSLKVVEDLDSAIKAIADAFTESVQNAVNKFDQAMAGTFGDLNYLQEYYDRQKTIDDLTLDTYEKIYQLNKLNRQITNSIDDTDNIAGKEKLLAIQQEINALQASDDAISQHKVEMLTKEYELELARIALEDAQNAKNQVRMTRDNEGNWGYVYTADETATNDAQQNLADKIYEYEALTDSYRDEMTNKYLSTLAEFEQALSACAAEDTERIEEIKTQYGILLAYYAQGVEDSVLETQWLQGEFNVTGHDLVDNWKATWLGSLTGTDSMTGIMTLFTTNCDQMMAEIGAAIEVYDSRIEIAMNAAGTSVDGFSSTVSRAITDANNDADDAINKADELKNQYSDAFGSAASAAIDFANNYATSIQATINNTKKAVESINTLIKALAKAGMLSDGSAVGTYSATVERVGSSGGGGTSGGGGSAAQFISDVYYGKSGSGSARVNYFKSQGYSDAEISSYQGIINDFYSAAGGNSTTAWTNLKKKYGFATGGYTGDWGNSGRLAFVHQKELILNADDTANFLAAVDIVRDITNSIDLNAQSQGIGLGALTAAGVTNASNLQQDVTIHAEFPNAVNHSEIEEAFDNLINKASQFAGRTV